MPSTDLHRPDSRGRRPGARGLRQGQRWVGAASAADGRLPAGPEEFGPFLDTPVEIRQVVYTTNALESNDQLQYGLGRPGAGECRHPRPGVFLDPRRPRCPTAGAWNPTELPQHPPGQQKVVGLPGRDDPSPVNRQCVQVVTRVGNSRTCHPPALSCGAGTTNCSAQRPRQATPADRPDPLAATPPGSFSVVLGLVVVLTQVLDGVAA